MVHCFKGDLPPRWRNYAWSAKRRNAKFADPTLSAERNEGRPGR